MNEKMSPRTLEYYTESVYSEEVSYLNDWVKDLESMFVDGFSSDEQRCRITYDYFKTLIEKAILEYTSGCSCEVIRETVSKALYAFLRYREETEYDFSLKVKSDYFQFLWLISLGCIFGVDEVQFDEVLDHRDVDDALIYRLVKSKFPQKSLNEGELLYPKIFGNLLQGVDERDPELILNYLKKDFYKGQRGCYWYNTHKDRDSGFFGYWCFASAILTVHNGLDSALFGDNKYYPYEIEEYLSC